MSTDVANVLAAYVGNNPVPPDQLASVADSIRVALGEKPAEPEVPAVVFPGIAARELTAKEIKDAVKPADILCFEDGKRYKTLRRTLTKFGLTPEQYLAKWKLPADFPLVSADYSAARRSIAISQGLGHAGE